MFIFHLIEMQGKNLNADDGRNFSVIDSHSSKSVNLMYGLRVLTEKREPEILVSVINLLD